MDPYSSLESQGLNGMEITAVGLADPEYKHHLASTVYPNGTVIFESGFDLDLLLLLQFALNFTFRAIDGEGWIDHLPNGSWSGIGRQVDEEEAILSISQSTMVPYRVRAFDFLFPTDKANLMAYFRQPSENSIRNMLTSVFTLQVWVCLIFIGSLVLASLNLVQILTKKMDSENKLDDLFTKDAIFSILGSFCQRSVHGSPDSIAARIIYLSLLTTSFLVFVAFSASLMAHLAIKIVPIRSLGDFIRSDIPIFGDIAVPYEFPTLERIQQLKNQRGTKKDNFVHVTTGIEKVTRGYASFVTFPVAMYTAIRTMNVSDQYFCDNFYQIKISGSGEGTPSGMFLKKGSKLRKSFNSKIALLYERGFVRRLHGKREALIFPLCSAMKNKSSRLSLGLNDVNTAFTIIIGGVIFGLMILGLEYSVIFHELAEKRRAANKSG